MTKKNFILLLSLLLFFIALPLQAQKIRSEADALAIANSFFPQSRGNENIKQTLAYTERDSATSHPYYYVFNRDNDKGWIIICADERTKSILGYSDTGHFDMNSAPPEMKAWLKDYSAQLRDLSATPDEVLKNLDKYVLSKARSKGSQSFSNVVKPLLGRIAYGQDYPYNLMTPVYDGENSVTGCVATGIVQIMRYWKYPKKPTGKSHSYEFNGDNIGTYFNTTYDWASMLPYYKNVRSTQRQNNAISKLMVDVGISSDMEYSPEESAAYTTVAAGNLSNFFDYDKNMVIYKRRDFSQANFVYFLKRELNAGRPVLFAGSGGGSGHCFVCDGYDANGLFHFNWGWDGMCNGYYSINNLAPSQVGTGGGYGRYNDDVLFVGGIRPNTGKGRHTWVMRMKNLRYPNTATLGQRSKFTFVNLGNETLETIKGSVGIALYQNGAFSKILGQQRIDPLESEYYWDEIGVSTTWPTTLANGNYQAVAVFKVDGDDKWRPVLNSKCNSYDLKVTGRSIRLSQNTRSQYSDIDDNPFDISPDGYEQGIREYDQTENTTNPVMASQLAFHTPVRSGNVTATAVLTSRGAYQGKVGVFLYDSQFDNCIATLQAKTVSVRDGKTSVNFNGVVQLSPGTYGAAIFYTDRQGKWILVPNEENSCVTFTVGSPGRITPPNPFNVVSEDDNIMPGGDDDYGGGYDFNDDNIIPGEEYGLGNMDDDDDWDYDFYGNRDDDDDDDDYLNGYDNNNDNYNEYYNYENVDNNGNYGFLDFISDVLDIFAKGSNMDETLKCESVQFEKAKPITLDGKTVYSFRLGQEDELSVKVINSDNEECRRIINASIFDSDGNWVADMSESFVIVPAKGEKTVHLPLQFTDVPPGPYRMCITEADSESENSQQMAPQSASQMLIQIKR